MVGVQDEQRVERLGENRVVVVDPLDRVEHHVQEVLGELLGVVGIDERHPGVEAVGARGDRRHLGDEPHDLLVPDLGVVDRLGLGIEGRQRGDGGHEHAHRMGVVVEALHEALAHVLVDERVVRDLVVPGVELRRRRQLAVDEEIRDLDVRRVRGEVLDRVAPIPQDAVVAVELGDRAAAGGGGHERGVEEPHVGEELAPLGGVDAAVDDRYLDRLAGAIVGDGDGFRHQPNEATSRH